MKKLICSIVLLCTMIISMNSCASVDITSVKSPDFNKKIDKVFITMKGAEAWMPFFEIFKTNLQDKLKAKSIQTECYVFAPLSLDSENDLLAKINAYQPNIVMTINQTETSQISMRNATYTGRFDVKMFEPLSDKPIWRANMVVYSQMDLSEGAKTSAEKLVAKLKQDKIID